MSADQDNKVANVQQQPLPRAVNTYVPDVDIMEDRENIRLLADLPGVNQSAVELSVENNILTIEATASLTEPKDCTLAGQEYALGRYHRDFTLSDAVNTDGIRAKVRRGVLEVTLPKREEVKARKIKID